MTDALSFLQSIQGFSRDADPSSARLPWRIAVVDPAYAAGTILAKVTFEGESTLSGKSYAFIDGYYPVATDRVLMAPIGSTYVIMGRIGQAAAQGITPTGLMLSSFTINGTDIGGGVTKWASAAANGGAVGVTETVSYTIGSQPFKPGRAYEVEFGGGLSATVASGTFPLFARFRLRRNALAGALVGDYYDYPIPVTGRTFPLYGKVLVGNFTGATITDTLVITLQGAATTGTPAITVVGSATTSRWAKVREVGSIALITGATPL